MTEFWEVVKSIPEGQVASYGWAGSEMAPPVSGLVAGRWLDHCPPAIPWWRVVGADGSLKIAKKSPEMAIEQRQRLEREGVEFEEDLVPKRFFVKALHPND